MKKYIYLTFEKLFDVFMVIIAIPLALLYGLEMICWGIVNKILFRKIRPVELRNKYKDFGK